MSETGYGITRSMGMHQRKVDGHPLTSTVNAAATVSSAGGPRLRVVLLADDTHRADVVRDHIQSIKQLSRHFVRIINPIQNRYGWQMAVTSFDVILIHYSICILSDFHLPPTIAEIIRQFPGPKLQILQDEMRWIDRMTRRMAELGIGAVFSSLTPENINRVYHHEYLAGVLFFSGLPGYVPRRLHKIEPKPLVERPYHIVYRGRPLPIWLGRFGQEKVQIGRQAHAMADKYALAVDCKTEEEDRIYGKAWNELLLSGRAALATEGGATVFDFDESVERGVAEYRVRHPNATDDDVWKAVVKPHEGNIVHKTITPRIFEAAMSRTALVLYPGTYRGILDPWEHYIPLEPDRSNEMEVAAFLKDEKRLESLIERTYRRIADDPLLQTSNYVSAVDHVVDNMARSITTARPNDLSAAAGFNFWSPAGPLIGIAERRMSAFENPHTPSGRIWNRIVATHIVQHFRSFVQPHRSQDLDRIGFMRRDDTAKADALNVLILCDFNACHIGTVRDHLQAFRSYSSNNVFIFDTRTAARLLNDLDSFDVIVLHYSIVISMNQHIAPSLARKIREFPGYKILYMQDEYRWVDRSVAAIADLGIDLLYTVINEDAIDAVYHHPIIRHVRRKTTLAGFVPQHLVDLAVPRLQDRGIDVGYRARRVPAWLGSFSQEKWRIGERFKEDATQYGLVCDIEHDESRRLYGDKWINFVSNCKAMLGTESGASIIDFSGTVQSAVEAFELSKPDASFEEIQEKFLEGHDGDIVIRVISPRCFEAAALRTLMILYPGQYSGALEPWRHYVPLERDHSNIAEVVAVLRDHDQAQEIIDNAYREVALNPRFSFQAMVKDFDDDLLEHRTEIEARVQTLRRAPATVALRSVEHLLDLELEGERRYRRRGARKIALKQMLYVSVHWIIRTALPTRWQETTRRALKFLLQNVWPFRKLV